jgi:hypothetical protein
MLGQAAQSAARPDKHGPPAVRLVWKWYRNGFAALVRACVWQGYQAKPWRQATGVVIPKPGKDDYSLARSHRVISLLCCLGKVIERVVTGRLVRAAETGSWLHEGQFGSRNGRAAVDAVAVLMDHAQSAWQQRQIVGVLLMDVKGAFDHVSKAVWVRRLVELRAPHSLIRWTASFMDDRQVRMKVEGQLSDAMDIKTGLPQGLPVSPILFAIYLSGLFSAVEKSMADTDTDNSAAGAFALSYADDVD